MRIFRENMSLPEAKTWLHCRPCTPLRTLINVPQFTTWTKYYCQVPLLQTRTKCNPVHRPQCAAIMEIYGDHLLHCERGTHRICRHDAQVRLLQADLKKAGRHPVLEPWPFERHKERPDISALGSHGGSDMFDITFCHLLSQARIRDGLENPLILLKNAWDEKIRRFRSVHHASATAAKLFQMPNSTPGGWHPDAHRAIWTIPVNISSRTLSLSHYARATLFLRHAALLVANNAVCLMSGFDFEV